MGKIIPLTHTGYSKNVEEQLEHEDVENAKACFYASRDRLLDINMWQQLSGSFSSRFVLTDSDGLTALRRARSGDYFKIKIPAPAPDDKFDWIAIEKIESKDDEQYQEVYMVVRAGHGPVNGRNSIDHDFSDVSTCVFSVKRIDNLVTAGVYGRNDEVDTNEVEGVMDTIRNAVIAFGAISGLADFQWKNLMKGILDIPEEQ
jgi:hypothetical protein